MLVLLRITVGWHILYEGLWKYEQEEFTADNFLAQTSGPFAELYQKKVVKDFQWRKHLDKQWNFDELDKYYHRFTSQVSLDADGQSAAERALAARKANVASSLDNGENIKLITDYFKRWDCARRQTRRARCSQGRYVVRPSTLVGGSASPS
ncbi:MAG: hypothetical protein QM775_13850 [Pirellulales bacterium]